jgi:hypothetical protein
MTLFAFRRVKSHGWTFYDHIIIDGLRKKSSTRPLRGAQIDDLHSK